jgi:hypothetical protein
VKQKATSYGHEISPRSSLAELTSILLSFRQNLLKADAALCPTQLKDHLLAHTFAEAHALDSHQNILFPLLLFHNLTLRPPQHISLVSHAFKQHRFTNIHVPSFRWPSERFTFIGIDPPECVVPRAVLDRGEEMEGVGLWREDWYGRGERLVQKRRRRNPWETGGDGWYKGILRPLVEWKGPVVYPCRLPWAEPVIGHDASGCGNCAALSSNKLTSHLQAATSGGKE